MERKRRRSAKWDAAGVKALREHLRVTQDQLAEQLGMRQQTISEWERGAYEPRGASSKLLSMVAEEAGFAYESGEPAE